jgi:exonuclease SbcC
MRPIRLELEGFTAYRELAVCDFEGVDLFVLTGPTGAGKSSIIDAITFALYGSVSRYGNPNLVHPVISQGKIECRVRFDFSVAGKVYTAVRVVRRTKGGASTREARLESGGQTLAGSAEELSHRVREILGLNFDQFTTCVVLPQGDFARFLHETPAARQDLLTKLLGVDVFEKMGALARDRERDSKQRANLLEDELEKLKDASAESKKAWKARVAELTRLKGGIERAEPGLAELRDRTERERANVTRLETEAALLEALEVPAGAITLAKKMRASRNSLEDAVRARAEADDALSRAESELAQFCDPVELREVVRAYRALDEKQKELAVARAQSSEAEATRRKAEKENRDAEEAERRARGELEDTRRGLAAHDLATHLEVGRPCPVCLRAVEELPRASIPPALSNAEKSLAKAEKARARAFEGFQEASKSALVLAERARAIEREIEALRKKLGGARPVEEIEAELTALEAKVKELSKARERATEARKTEMKHSKEVEKLAADERRSFGALDEARDALSPLGSPSIERDELERAWRSLHEWARARIPHHRALAEKAKAAMTEAVAEREKRLVEIRSRCEELGVEISLDRPRDAVVSALARAESEHDRILRAIERASTLRDDVQKERENARVAGTLGQHLRSSGFERWLLEEAIRQLVSGATTILNELSTGQYSFEHDDRMNFEVVDHANADERRSARTLSGGETFLASLALALTLAEQTAELATRGSAKIESLFLDEGFGTLDDDTLEVVATAIAELGARGRVVGVVTHQPNLAATIPVQYRVSKNPVTSTVTKVVI